MTTGIAIDHKTKAQLHNILADCYNYLSNRKGFTAPSPDDIMALMSTLNKAPEAEVTVVIRGGVGYVDSAPMGISVEILDMDEMEEMNEL